MTNPSEVLFEHSKTAIAIRAAKLKAHCKTCGALRGWCDTCEPQYRHWKEAIKSNLPLAKVEYLEKARLADIQVGEYSHESGKVGQVRVLGKDIVEPYINNFQTAREKGLSFLFVGKNNGGKTTAAVQIALALSKKRYLTYYCTFPQLHSLHGESFREPEKHDLMEAIRAVDLLIVDELGKEHTHSESTRYLADTFLKSREENLLPTIIITNKPIQDLRPDENRKTFGDYGTSFWAMLGERYRIIVFKDSDLRRTYKTEWPF